MSDASRTEPLPRLRRELRTSLERMDAFRELYALRQLRRGPVSDAGHPT